MTSPTSKLLETPFDELINGLGGPGRAAGIMRALRSGHTPEEFPDVGRRTLKEYHAKYHFTPPELIAVQEAADRTLKMVFQLDDAARVETVVIPSAQRTTVCVSSQVGCARGCQFCMTAEMGLMRHLSTSEILIQVWWARRIVRERHYPTLRNVVFMGMGEPLDNWSAVKPAIDYLIDQRMHGFGARHVTLSTVGPSPEKIRRLESVSCRLAWSLHATETMTRRRLIPTQRHQLDELFNAFESITQARGDSLFIEYTLVAGVNDTTAMAYDLVKLADRLGAGTRINLLPVNPGREGMNPPNDETCEAFAQILRDHGYRTMLRLTRGQDQSAACGQLVQRLEKKRVGNASPTRFITID